MIDHYKVLGLSRTATKDEIKQAFKKLAVKFHPDKHSQSPKSIQDDAVSKFKLVSDAYEVLSDDRKRADYNLRYRTSSSSYGAGGGYGYQSRGGAYGYGYHGGGAYGSSYGGGGAYRRSEGVGSKFESLLRFMTTRAFLLNAAFVGVLVGAGVVIDSTGEALWKMHNSGKSFEETLESIEKAKSHKDKT